MQDFIIVSFMIFLVITMIWIYSVMKEYNSLPGYNILDMKLDLNDFNGELYYISLKDIYDGKTDYYSTNNFVFYKTNHYPYSHTFGLTENKTSQYVISTDESILECMIVDLRQKLDNEVDFNKCIYQIQYKGESFVRTQDGQQIDLNNYEEFEYLGFDKEIKIDQKNYKLRG